MKFLLKFQEVPFLKKSDNKNRTIKTKNNTFAMEAALEAIPPKPKKAAIIAISKNPADHRNIKFSLSLFLLSLDIKILCHNK